MATEESIQILTTQRARTEKLYNSLLSSADQEISYRESCGFKYSLTYLLFLLGKAALFAILLALIVNLYGYSVLPVYSMHSSSYLAGEVQSANQKDPLQPWVGLLIAGLLAGSFYLGGDILTKFKGMFNASPKTEQIKEKADPSQAQTQDIPIVDVPQQEESTELEEGITDMPDGESDYFMCYDGNYIPNSMVYDNNCDCPTCEDEDVGD